LQYREVYGLQQIETMIRGTLRFHGFCAAWNVLVQAGVTDDTYVLQGVEQLTHQQFLERFVPAGPDSFRHRLAHVARVDPHGPELELLTWAGFFSDEPVGRADGTPAQITEHLLSKCWSLQAEHRDLVVMWHRFRARHGAKNVEIESYFSARGDAHETAMAKTVGLPLAIAAKLLLTGAFSVRGVVVPVQQDVYQPILEELDSLGIHFTETERLLNA
jgi:saccharopine dehydrogenase (NADP+, L-glutamate forming)